MKRIWRRYYDDAHGIIYVVDAADIDRFPEAASIIRELLTLPELARKPLLVLANKRDIPEAVSTQRVERELFDDITEVRQTRPVQVLAVSALTWCVRDSHPLFFYGECFWSAKSCSDCA